MGVWIQLALGLTLTAGPSVGAATPPVMAAPVRSAACVTHVRRPPPAIPTALAQARFSRRVTSPRIERGPTPLGTRPCSAPQEGWTALRGAPEPLAASHHLAAFLERGPPTTA
jgi:hypothetical protein